MFKMTGIFKLFKNHKKEKFLSCRFIQNGITFMDKSIIMCCSNKGGVRFIANYKGEKINWKEINKKRQEIIGNCRKGIIPEACHGCVNLETQEWDLSDYKLKEIYINHWNHCNCGCVYCIQGADGKYLQAESSPSPYYRVYEHLQSLYKHKLISPKLHLEILGGEISVLDEADDIINLCLNNGVERISFHSSCITYSKGIERALKEAPDVDIDFSLDCASKDLYKKIKRIDAFDDVIDNLSKYIKSSPKAPDAFIAKYIIIDGLNDNTGELDKWLALIHNLGIKKAKLDVNFRKYFSELNSCKPDVPPVYYEMYKLFYKRIKEYGMEEHCWEFPKRVLNTGGIPEGY